ncbi:hypothetical protein AXF24_12200 [Streptococcus pneumoniae]|nr:hypothetical protein AXF24_12200 [Streptococcus pneumoniae]
MKMFGRDACTSLVDGLFMFGCPSAECFERGYLFFGDGSVFLRADVEQEVAAHAQAVDKGT